MPINQTGHFPWLLQLGCVMILTANKDGKEGQHRLAVGQITRPPFPGRSPQYQPQEKQISPSPGGEVQSSGSLAQAEGKLIREEELMSEPCSPCPLPTREEKPWAPTPMARPLISSLMSLGRPALALPPQRPEPGWGAGVGLTIVCPPQIPRKTPQPHRNVGGERPRPQVSSQVGSKEKVMFRVKHNLFRS